MMIWHDIKDFPNYEISNTGIVKNKTTGKELKPGDNGKGYLYINLMKNNKIYRRYIHRLVAFAFIPNTANLPLINHKDENKSNNNASNLEWCDNKYNINYGTANIRRRKAQKCKKVLCVETDTIYPSVGEAARQNNLIRTNIMNVCNGKGNTCGGYHWKYI